MAYIVYYACDCCGAEGGVWLNTTVSQSRAAKIARERGWQVGKRGYIWPKCQCEHKSGSQPQKEDL